MNMQTSELILKRIDTIMAELQILRQQVLTLETRLQPSSPDIVDELAGSLGQGTWDEYDTFLEWEQFSE